ncbi:MAG: leucine-rich repeat protein [Prevotella sp.]|nr:leucine-rich repeat protein [Prevotella sp.]
MPEKLQTVGEYAFSECHRMKTTLPEGLKTIEQYGFSHCHELNPTLPPI